MQLAVGGGNRRTQALADGVDTDQAEDAIVPVHDDPELHARAEEGGRNSSAETAGGVDANASKKHLADIAKRLDVRGRSRMTKEQLVEAIQKANDRETAKAHS